MNRRGRRLIAAIAGLVALLFAGRWVAGLLADRWWAAQISPAAVEFLTDWHVLRLTLDLAGFLFASAWFIGHLLLVYRAVGSVQVRRNVANLEFREALTPTVLLTVAVGSGALLGLLAGTGGAERWHQVVLAWQGVTYGMADPLMHNDAGLYVAQLPAWRLAHGFALLLVVLALGVVFGLYLLVGAVRWLEGRPAINDHARAHIGWLLTALALALVWGYLLEPYELVAGLDGPVDLSAWSATTLVSPLLVGVGLATAALSATWALRPRHALAAAGWIVLSLASVAGHWLVPPTMAGSGDPPAPAAVIDRLDRTAYGLAALAEGGYAPAGIAAPPTVPSLWNVEMIGHIAASDSNEVLAVEQAILPLRGRGRPVWLAVRAARDGRASVLAVADDQVSKTGQPLYYTSSDTIPGVARVAYLELGAEAFRPDAPLYRIETVDQRGVEVGGWVRRVMLAWALQAGGLLRNAPPQARVDWRLSPAERVQSLAPFVRWGDPVPRTVNRDLMWLVDGYVAPRTFPLSARLRWRGHEIGALHAGFLATVEASTGVTRIYLRPGADALASAWAVVTHGLVEPATAIPEAVRRAAPYPLELFRAQATLLESKEPGLGGLGGPPGSRRIDPPATDLTSWSPDTSGPVRMALYERAGDRHLGGVLTGMTVAGTDELHLIRFDSATALQSRTALENRWSHFASYDALSDSIGDENGKLEPGPVRLDLNGDGPLAYQSHFVRGPRGSVLLSWVTLAAPDDRLGAGRSLREAWSNLLGATVPAIAGTAQATRLDEARRWLERADSALRGGDWAAFGQAWRGLREALGLPAEPVKR